MVLAPASFSPAGGDGDASLKGGKRRGASVKTLKKMLKKAGLKTTGKKAALTRRVKKAHLKMRGGADTAESCEQQGMDFDGTKCVAKPPGTGGRKRKSRGSKKGKLGLMGY